MMSKLADARGLTICLPCREHMLSDSHFKVCQGIM